MGSPEECGDYDDGSRNSVQVSVSRGSRYNRASGFLRPAASLKGADSKMFVPCQRNGSIHQLNVGSLGLRSVAALLNGVDGWNGRHGAARPG